MPAFTDYSAVGSFFETIMDDSSYGGSSDFVLDLFAQAEIQLALERPWEIFTVYGSTISYASGDTYLTNYALPTDPAFLYALRVNLDRSISEYKKIVPMKDRYRYQNNSQFCAFDYRNSRLHLMGTRNAAGTIYLDYVMRPTFPTAAGTPPWPVQFRAVTAYRAAAILKGAVDADDINRVLAPNLNSVYQGLMDAMKVWDGRLKQTDRSPVDVARDQRDFPLQDTSLDFGI